MEALHNTCSSCHNIFKHILNSCFEPISPFVVSSGQCLTQQVVCECVRGSYVNEKIN